MHPMQHVNISLLKQILKEIQNTHLNSFINQ
jgi:hypothetical protein